MNPPIHAATRRGLRPAARPLSALLIAVAALLLAGCSGPNATQAAEAGGAPPSPTASPTTPEEPATPPPVEIADPGQVRIPAIDVDATLIDLGLQPDGSMEVPDFGLAGWYDEGPRPGEDGPAVVAAHVDSRQGPDVFFRLRDLAAGDEVTVTDENGQEHTFTVERIEQHDKDALPDDAIWGPTDGPALRLITCGGVFDAASGHYRDNIIVFATT